MVHKKRKVALNLVLKNYGDHKKAQECLGNIQYKWKINRLIANIGWDIKCSLGLVWGYERLTSKKLSF